MSASEYFWLIFDTVVVAALIIAYFWPIIGPIFWMFWEGMK